MSKRDWKLFVADMLEAMDNIMEYTNDLSKDEFMAGKMVKDAVVRNLEVLGEAAKQIPADIYSKYPDIHWKDIVGLRNIIIHQYFGVDYNVIWEIIENDLPPLRIKLAKILLV